MLTGKLTISGAKKELETYFNALKAEEGERTERASYSLTRRFGKLTINIRAKDFTAFRAVTTSILHIMAIVDKTIKANAQRF